MTRKKFIKTLMSKGFQRNVCNEVARFLYPTVNDMGGYSFQNFMDDIIKNEYWFTSNVVVNDKTYKNAVKFTMYPDRLGVEFSNEFRLFLIGAEKEGNV